jgi:hypothetical protein
VRPEQFLDLAQIAAAGQQVRRETVPQRMRGRAVGQAHDAAQRDHLPLHMARTEPVAARSEIEK